MSQLFVQSIPIVIIESDRYVREALMLMLTDQRIELIASCGTEKEGLAAIARHAPRVVLIGLPLTSGVREALGSIQRIRTLSPSSAILALISSDPDMSVLRAILDAGADDYYRKGYAHGTTLLSTVISLSEGQIELSQTLARELLLQAASNTPDTRVPPLPSLTLEEQDLLARTAQGESLNSIANALSIPEQTLKRHFHNIVRKFHYRTNRLH